MDKLYLDTLHINPYNEKAVCAYVYYGKEDKPKDHHNQPIGSFYQHHEEFSRHLNDIVLPKINSRLKNFGYVIQGVDFLNQAPHPFFNIVKRNGKAFTQDDLNDIAEKLNATLDKLNKNSQSFFAMASTSNTKNIEEKSAQPSHKI